ncbi:hypothetical protein A9Q91_02980 [Candidatus Gracilibacteria bacterium 28_42_T64]|nr:hypothetical protein A9Q91_02980 [Candidatus Gracilibacteria bacterium 28_42_T64]
MHRKIEAIRGLINNIEKLEDLDFDSLDRIKKKSNMVLLKVFGDESAHINGLKNANFSVISFTIGRETPIGRKIEAWNKGKKKFINTLEVCIDELELDIGASVMEKTPIKERKMSVNIKNFNGNLSGENYGTQEFINSGIDDIIDQINEKNIEFKTEIIKLLEEIKSVKEPEVKSKKFLEVINLLGSGASINSYIMALGAFVAGI